MCILILRSLAVLGAALSIFAEPGGSPLAQQRDDIFTPPGSPDTPSW